MPPGACRARFSHARSRASYVACLVVLSQTTPKAATACQLLTIRLLAAQANTRVTVALSLQ